MDGAISLSVIFADFSSVSSSRQFGITPRRQSCRDLSAMQSVSRVPHARHIYNIFYITIAACARREQEAKNSTFFCKVLSACVLTGVNYWVWWIKDYFAAVVQPSTAAKHQAYIYLSIAGVSNFACARERCWRKAAQAEINLKGPHIHACDNFTPLNARGYSATIDYAITARILK